VVQRVAQPSAAHAGLAAVEQGQQRRRRLAAQRFGNLQVAPGRSVHAHELVVAFDPERADVGDAAALGGARVFEQRAGGADGCAQTIAPEAGQIARLELPYQGAGRGIEIELPQRQRLDGILAGRRQLRREALGDQDFGGLQAVEFGQQSRRRGFLDAEVAACQ
jgi:hypothetical protein